LQILEEGRLTDSVGRKIDFRNTIIVMTSNLGADLIRKSTEMGFGAKESTVDKRSMQEKIDGAVKKHFKPEFLNRLDGLVMFNILDKAAYKQIIDLEFRKLTDRLTKKNIHITVDETAKDWLVEKAYLPEMGARPLRRMVEQYLEDPLAEKLLQNPGAEKKYVVSVKDGALVFIDQDPTSGGAKPETALVK